MDQRRIVFLVIVNVAFIVWKLFILRMLRKQE